MKGGGAGAYYWKTVNISRHVRAEGYKRETRGKDCVARKGSRVPAGSLFHAAITHVERLWRQRDKRGEAKKRAGEKGKRRKAKRSISVEACCFLAEIKIET